MKKRYVAIGTNKGKAVTIGRYNSSQQAIWDASLFTNDYESLEVYDLVDEITIWTYGRA